MAFGLHAVNRFMGFILTIPGGAIFSFSKLMAFRRLWKFRENNVAALKLFAKLLIKARVLLVVQFFKRFPKNRGWNMTLKVCLLFFLLDFLQNSAASSAQN